MDIPRGKFVWFELLSTDVAKSLDFYKHVMGWTSATSPLPGGGTYTRLEAQGRGVGGIYAVSKEQAAQGMAPGWVGYISTPTVDADLERLKNLGGASHGGAQDIPSVGRFVPVSDPQQGGFILFQPTPPPGEVTPLTPGSVGTVGWCELRTTDWKPAFAFYSELFGWKRGDAMDMGPAGTYQLFLQDGQQVGGMMNRMEHTTPPHWLYYFVVDAMDAGMQRVTSQGGQVVNGPHQVPGGAWTAQCRDPHGVTFALTAAKR